MEKKMEGGNKSGRKEQNGGQTTTDVPSMHSSLVKYDNPYLVSTHDKKKTGGGDGGLHQGVSGNTVLVLNAPGHCSGDGGTGRKETEEILNTILPPKEWKDDAGNVWRQTVSTVPATRQDVINLEEQLNIKLKQMQARETGICPIRRELYSQCFDELIRQVTINCAERGILLLRVRDEMNMTLEAYRTLYESSTAYGMRKALMAESGKTDLEARIGEITAEKGNLELSVSELQAKLEEIEAKYLEQKGNEEKKHADEIAFLKKANQQIKTQLEAMVAPKKTAQ